MGRNIGFDAAAGGPGRTALSLDRGEKCRRALLALHRHTSAARCSFAVEINSLRLSKSCSKDVEARLCTQLQQPRNPFAYLRPAVRRIIDNMPGSAIMVSALLFGWLKTLYPIWARFGPGLSPICFRFVSDLWPICSVRSDAIRRQRWRAAWPGAAFSGDHHLLCTILNRASGL